MELYHYKEDILEEIPMLSLSLEIFGTLEAVEDYLLNKLNSKDDIYATSQKIMQRSKKGQFSFIFNLPLTIFLEQRQQQFNDQYMDKIESDFDDDENDDDYIDNIEDLMEEQIPPVNTFNRNPNKALSNPHPYTNTAYFFTIHLGFH